MRHLCFTVFIVCIPALMTTLQAQVRKPEKIYSPDRQTSMQVGVNKSGNLVYRVDYTGSEVIAWSQLGFEINGINAGENTFITEFKRTNVDEKFPWKLGEKDTIVNRYNQIDLACQTGVFKFNLTARVFNGGVAFQYKNHADNTTENYVITHENTAYNLNRDYTIYQYHHESVFTPVSIDSLKNPCDFPATLKNRQFYVSIGEAANINYTKAELNKGKQKHGLAIEFNRDREVKLSGAFRTPWRTISISKTAIGLHHCSDLNLKLIPPSADGIPEWIEPGKLIRSQLNTQSGMECIDFAAKHHFKYIMFDGGWYGPMREATSHPQYAIPAIDLPRVIAYGKQKDIGIILYLDYAELRSSLDSLLPLYKKWGVRGLKFGFVDGLKQEGIIWLVSAIKKVYDYGFILNIHDNYKPTGLSRTYPSLLTQEGIRGDENSPDAFHTTLLPFTRYLAGAADFTYCYPNQSNAYAKNLKVSMGHQLALTVVYFSPLQAMFWYGKPTEYTNEREIEFFGCVPTVWNESHYLAGEAGRYISVARRSGSDWFVGNAAGPEDWKGKIRFDFLAEGATYKAVIYNDNNGSISKDSMEVNKHFTFPVDLKAKTGQAMIISPVKTNPAR